MAALPLLPKSPRIEVVDALRGFAVMSIVLLHNIEHFDFYFFPEMLPGWMKIVDGKIWETLFFLFGGKSYAIFALLFGFSFFIQFNNQEKKGADFRGRFLWRLFLLLGFGIFNSLFYQGDILGLYAVIGITLIPVRKWNDRAVFATALLFMLQPLELAKLAGALSDPWYTLPGRMSDYYFGQTAAYLGGHSFLDLVKGNLVNGRLAVIHWSWENGRFFQASGLFMLGMLLGRRGVFVVTDSHRTLWTRALVASAVLFLPLYYLKLSLPSVVTREALLSPLSLIVTSWSNFAFMVVLVSSFVLLYQRRTAKRVLEYLVPFGRMSLTNYIVQSAIGSFIYYGYGIGLYRVTGATYCVLIAVVLIALQLACCHWWLTSHAQGPFERLWHRATWM
jgi:uncharacterized protein